MIYSLLRQLISAKQWLMSGFYSDTKVYCSENIIKQLQYPPTEVQWKAIVPNNVILLERIVVEYSGNIITKFKVWYFGELYKKLTHDEIVMYFDTPVHTPWLWIGGSDGVDRSAELEPYILSGNVITPQLLSVIDKSITSWAYLCPETFERIDFPDDGIIIRSNVNSGMESSSKEM